ncbi:carboxypeptidase M32 [Halocatena pleomorpha]|uniref:Metal-dependent carboxypeptidase n=1 Tax=Halocatena pleomorpha TaxID=1785090 RepID=A0A3P3RL65_9EURY|nr:carboxypeptidase M32 [Halocatena pleomorpha]RRJ33133.1 carboxypeptidase M32 [Halocatena pleomorpha]
MAAQSYDEFIDHVKRFSNVEHAIQILNWDQEVMMPEGGTPARSQQVSTLSTLHHELLTSKETKTYLSAAESSSLTDEQSAVVREVRRKYERADRVPSELVEEIAHTTSSALPVWKEAKENDDFEAFAPTLSKLVDLKREYAEQIDPDEDPYAVLFAEYEPYLGLDTAERVLDRLRDRLVDLIDSIEESDATLETDAFSGTYPADEQEALCRSALDRLGYPWEHGRLDTAPHPFSTGSQFDARVTTRFSDDDPIDALTSTIHEFGHAMYTLGLPREQYGTPLGQNRNLSVHESQSRLWENHVGRSLSFWEQFLPAVTERFPETSGVSPRAAYETANQVYPDNLIRVEADELTYHLHIVLRFEIEKQLIHGAIDVEEVPHVWNEKMEEYLGVRPDTDSAGCLQDIHWTHGSFGYFPTYSLGSVLAAQLYATATADIEALDEQIQHGEFDALQEWLTDNVHQHGQRYTTPELIEHATGESLTADYFLDYVERKYGALYDL